MRPAYLKALGANDFEVICMIFRSFEQGQEWLQRETPFMWKEHEHTHPNFRYATHDEDLSEIAFKCRDLDELTYADVLDKIFTRWYFGCGEAYALELIELDAYNTPLVAWDLD
jgi:hypothetical protein